MTDTNKSQKQQEANILNIRKDPQLNKLKNPNRNESECSNCEFSEKGYDEDYLNTQEIQVLKGNNSTPAQSNKVGNFDTEVVLRRYTRLSSLLDSRANPLISNKGKIEQRVFEDMQRAYDAESSSSSSEEYYSKDLTNKCGCRQQTCQNCIKKKAQLQKQYSPREKTGAQFVSRKDRPTRNDRINDRQTQQQQEDGQNTPEIKEGILSAQQGIECDQAAGRLGPRSRLSRSVNSHYSKKGQNNLNQQQSNRFFDPKNSESQPLGQQQPANDLRESQLGNEEELRQNDDDDSGEDNQNIIVKNKGGTKNGCGSLEKAMMKALSKQADKQLDTNQGASGAEGSGAVVNQNVTLKPGNKKKGKGVERQLSLPKSGSKNNMGAKNKPGKSKFKPTKDKEKDKEIPAEGAMSPPGGRNGGIGLGPLGTIGDPLNAKAKQAVANTMNQMMNPFMKPAFHIIQPQDNNNTGSCDPQKIDAKKKGVKMQDEPNPPSKQVLQLDLGNKNIRRPSNNSSNNSNGQQQDSAHEKIRKDYQSQGSCNSSMGGLKSCFRSEDRRSSRRFMSKGNLDSQRVKFHESVGKYSEEEEEQKHYSNRRKYKKFPQQNGADKKEPQQAPDIKIMINMRRFVKEVNIKATDPLVCYPYFKYFLLDMVEKKKYQNDVDICKYYVTNQKKNLLLNPKQVATMQQQFIRIQKNQQNQITNFKDISQLKNAIKTSVKKTIVFDMDNTIMTTMYKKNEIQEYDAATYVKLFGHSALKIYLNYRPYLKEMLSELKKNDFELMLFSSHNAKYLEQVAATLQKDEAYFDFLINKDHLYFDRDLDLHILDLNILLSSGRDLKDIIVISNSCCRHLIQYNNGVPVKDYTGSKRDLSLFALTKYLRTFKDIKDVRTKIAEDFAI